MFKVTKKDKKLNVSLTIPETTLAVDVEKEDLSSIELLDTISQLVDRASVYFKRLAQAKMLKPVEISKEEIKKEKKEVASEVQKTK